MDDRRLQKGGASAPVDMLALGAPYQPADEAAVEVLASLRQLLHLGLQLVEMIFDGLLRAGEVQKGLDPLVARRSQGVVIVEEDGLNAKVDGRSMPKGVDAIGVISEGHLDGSTRNIRT